MKPLAGLVWFAFLLGCGSAPDSPDRLGGAAEDLWGERVELAEFASGPVLIHPFSPANCGYCLVDGGFMAENFLQQAKRSGGEGFHQCLFNPQLDVVATLKHFRERDARTLTYPLQLHRYHGDGFPFLAAFLDGERVFAGGASPYEAVSVRLKERLWPGAGLPTALTGPLKMADYFVRENEAELARWVLPDGDEAGLERVRRLAASLEESDRVTAKPESGLDEEERELNLLFDGVGAAFELSLLRGAEGPVSVDDSTLFVGPHAFPRASTALRACLPNPRDPQRYLLLELRDEEGRGAPFKGWLDFVVAGADPETGNREVLLEGRFAKDEANRWSWDERTVAGPLARAGSCAGGACPSPVADARPASERRPPPAVPEPQDDGGARSWSLGGAACRFPSIALDGGNRCWAAWEEQGDVLLARLAEPGEEPVSQVVEGGAGDAWNPVLAWDGERLWVVYAHEAGGDIRVLGRHWDGVALSQPLPLSENRLCDALLPALAGDGRGRLTVVWSEWRANQRFLLARDVEHGAPRPVRELATAPAEIDYVDAWWPSLAVDARGVWGAWNQHYPATLGVCGGTLSEPAVSITAIRGGVEDNERGGYPDVAVSAAGERWVAWESFAWDALGGEPQSIFAARWDDASTAWLPPERVSRPSASVLSQTPQIAGLPDGRLVAVWSGRPEDGDAEWGQGPWRLFLSLREDGRWSEARALSPAGETARAPRLAVAADGGVWVAWQSGVGDGMRVEVRRLAAL